VGTLIIPHNVPRRRRGICTYSVHLPAAPEARESGSHQASCQIGKVLGTIPQEEVSNRNKCVRGTPRNKKNQGARCLRYTHANTTERRTGKRGKRCTIRRTKRIERVQHAPGKTAQTRKQKRGSGSRLKNGSPSSKRKGKRRHSGEKETMGHHFRET